MISAWTKHLKTEEEKDRFRNSVQGSKIVLERLQELLEEVEGEMDSVERNIKIYDIPGWDYRIAHLNGFKDCLNKVSKIITLDQGNK